MKSFLSFIVCLLSVSGFGANPTFQAFKGTNGTTIRTNVNGNLVSVDSSPGNIATSNSLVAQIASGQVWTNDGSIPAIVPIVSTNAVGIGTGFTDIQYGSMFEVESSGNELQSAPTAMFRADRSGLVTDGRLTLRALFTGVGSDDGGATVSHSAILGEDFVRADIARSIYFVGGANGIVGSSGGSNHGVTNASFGVRGIASGRDGLLVGVIGIADPVSNGKTNVGVIGVSIDEGLTGPPVGGYFEVGSDGFSGIPIWEAGALICDNRARPDFPLFIARTNNGTFKAFEVDGNKTTNATPMDVKGQITAFGGLTVTTTASIKTNIANLSITSTDFILNQYYTNSAQRAYVAAVFLCDSGISIDAGKVGLYLDQDASGGFEQTGMVVGVDLGGDGQYQLGAWLQPGARFVFTNLSSGTGSATTAAGSSQWVKQ